MAGLMEEHLGTEIKPKKRFLDLRDTLFLRLASLLASLEMQWALGLPCSPSNLPPLTDLLTELEEIAHKTTRRRPLEVNAETPQEWASRLLSQLDDVAPSDDHEDSVPLEAIDIEKEQAESSLFMADAERGIEQLNEVSSMMDPDPDEFDESAFRTRVRVFFDTNKKALFYLRKKSKQTVLSFHTNLCHTHISGGTVHAPGLADERPHRWL